MYCGMGFYGSHYLNHLMMNYYLEVLCNKKKELMETMMSNGVMEVVSSIMSTERDEDVLVCESVVLMDLMMYIIDIS